MSKQLFIQHERLGNQLYYIAKAAFEKIQKSRVIHDDSYMNPHDRHHPARGYIFDDFDFNESTGLRLSGTKYAGCGEYDGVFITVPTNRIDDLDLFIREQRTKIVNKIRARIKARQEKEDNERLEQEQYEREQFERLKAKYEGK